MTKKQNKSLVKDSLNNTQDGGGGSQSYTARLGERAWSKASLQYDKTIQTVLFSQDKNKIFNLFLKDLSCL